MTRTEELTYFFLDDPLGYPVDGSQFESKRIQVLADGCKLQRPTPQLVAPSDVLDGLAHSGQQGHALLLVGIQVLRMTQE